MKINKRRLVYRKFNSCFLLENELSLLLSKRINLSIEKKGYASIALSGGKTPLSLYKKLSKKDIEWKRTNLYLVDERAVHLTSKDSNQYNILSALSKKTSDFREFRSFDYKKKIKGKVELINSDKKFSFPINFTLLGMGDDGHFASIFPNLEDTELLLDCNNKDYISYAKTNEKIPHRFTMTYKTISQSEMIVIFIKGEKKLSLIKNIIENEVSPSLYPIKKIFNDFKNEILLYWCK